MAVTTAKALEEQYGDMIRAEYGDGIKERALRNAFVERAEPVIVSDGVLRHWMKVYSLPKNGIVVPNVETLHKTFKKVLKELVEDHDTPYKLTKALRLREEQPVHVTEGIVKKWFQQYHHVPSGQTRFSENGKWVSPKKGVRTYFGILY